MTKTKPTKKSDIKREWHLIDVGGKVLGRISTEIAQLLIGKAKPYYIGYLDVGDNVVVVNASKIKTTGSKKKKKIYTRYSGYPGGLKKEPFEKLLERKPEEIIRKSVTGMLPKNKLRNRMLKRLFIYSDNKHPYENKISARGGSASG